MSASERTRQQVAERRQQVMELRAAGMPFADIARRLGHKTASAAVQDLTRAMADARATLSEQLPAYITLELARLDLVDRTCQVTMGQAVQAGDWETVLRAAGTLVRLSQRRSELLGINLAAKPAGPAKGTEDDVDELAERRRRRRSQFTGR